MIITIGGNLGAGKTTLAAGLVKALGYEELYIGGLMREMAAEQNLAIEEFYVRLKHNPELEKSVDERQEAAMREKDNLIVQGRVAWFFAQGSPFNVFNIFLAVTPEVCAARTAERAENAGKSPETMIKINTTRVQNEIERYKTLYRIENFLDPVHYDFILDTTALTEEEVLNKILSEIELRKKATAA